MNRYLLILVVLPIFIISWKNPCIEKARLAGNIYANDPGDTLKLNDLIFSDFISPNGDGFNDLFIIVNVTFYPNNSLKIFNRWGEVVYHAEPYTNNWEGINNSGGGGNGNKLTDGVYYFEFYDGIGNNASGKITLKR